jgi:hypothetical protein
MSVPTLAPFATKNGTTRSVAGLLGVASADETRPDLTTAQVGAGFCSRPIVMACPGCDSQGTLSHQPHTIYQPCGTRRADRCPACSELYSRQAFHAVKKGAAAAISEGVEGFVFATFTPPGADFFGSLQHTFDSAYWKTVTTGKKATGLPKQCHPFGQKCPGCGEKVRCGKRHRPGDGTAGAPIHPQCFRYSRAARWQQATGKLWSRTMDELRRLGVVPIYSKTAEPQARGLMHFHAIFQGGPEVAEIIQRVSSSVRLRDDATGELVPVLTYRTGPKRGQALPAPYYQRGPKKGQPKAWAPSTSASTRWGKTDTKLIGPELPGDDEDAKPTALANRVAYLVKYATKSAATTQEFAPQGSLLAKHYARMREAGRVCRHVACAVALEAWRRDLVEQPELLTRDRPRCRRAVQVGEQWGYAGHFLTISRQWGWSLGAERASQRDHAREVAGLPPWAPALLSPHAWAYSGQGFDAGHENIRVAVLEANREAVTARRAPFVLLASGTDPPT